MDGAALIAAERNRQVTEESWTSAHDDTHDNCEILDAAAQYVQVARTVALSPAFRVMGRGGPGPMWPWEPEAYKPSQSPVRNLVKAGALIAAEIDRLRRLDDARHEGQFVV